MDLVERKIRCLKDRFEQRKPILKYVVYLTLGDLSGHVLIVIWTWLVLESYVCPASEVGADDISVRSAIWQMNLPRKGAPYSSAYTALQQHESQVRSLELSRPARTLVQLRVRSWFIDTYKMRVVQGSNKISIRITLYPDLQNCMRKSLLVILVYLTRHPDRVRLGQ